MIFPSKSLHFRLVRYVFLSLLLFSIIAGLLTYRFTFSHQLAASRDLVEQVVATVKPQAEVAAFALNREIGGEVLNGLMNTPLFKGVRLESSDGFLLEKKNFKEGDTPESFTYPLFSPTTPPERIGSLIVYPNDARVRMEAARVSLSQTLLMLIQLLLATMLTIWVSRRVLSRPVSDLARRVAAVKPGGGARVPIPASHDSDEIGLLSRGINTLLDTVELALTESREARRGAEAATRAKSEFLANMSHEIRTPLNAVIGLSELSMSLNGPPKLKDFITKIHASGSSLLGIINDILDFSKIEAGKLELESTPFDLDRIINELSLILSPDTGSKDLEILFDLKQRVPRSLVGDPLRLSQILTNLGNNAVKFTHSGHILIHVDTADTGENGDIRDTEYTGIAGNIKNTEHTEITGVSGNTGNETVLLEFSVEDTGIGMSPQQMETLFDSFTQADMSTTRKYGGTGLGLCISKHLTERMGGNLRVSSTPGQGSRFSFTARFGTLGGKAAKPPSLSDAPSSPRVLVVDDNPVAREVFCNTLDTFSFHAKAVASGSEAVAELENTDSGQAYDLILMDWNMPGMDGIQTAAQIKTNPHLSRIPAILMVTAHDSDEIRVKAEKAGIDGILYKPVTPSLLFDTIATTRGRAGLPNSVRNESPAPEIQGLDSIRGARILVVEDNEINMQLAVEILQNRGFSVGTAKNGLEALRALFGNGEYTEKEAGQSYDAVLMDIQMPEMDGYTATVEIRKRENQAISRSRLPVIAMTAHAMTGERERCIRMGLDDYISKPINTKLLLGALVRWIKPSERFTQARPSVQEEEEAPLVIPDNIRGIDTEAGLAVVDGSGKSYLKILSLFMKNNRHSRENIENALEKREFEKALMTTHALKGVSGNIGAWELFHLSSNLEESIKARDLNGTNALLDDFSLALGVVLHDISMIIGKREQAHPVRLATPPSLLPAGDREKILNNLSLLRMCIDRDISDCHLYISAIREITGETTELKTIETAVEDFDEDLVLDEIGGLEKKYRSARSPAPMGEPDKTAE